MMIMSLLVFVLGVIAIYFAGDALLKVVLINLASREKEKAFLVISMKQGRIKFRVRAGRIVQFLANLQGLKKNIDEETGIIDDEDKQPNGNEKNWLWKRYGVRWIGLDSVFTFPIEKYDLKGGTKDELEKKSETAESLFFRGSYLDSLPDAETMGGQKVTVIFRIGIETTHAGKTIQYKYFLPLILDAVKSCLRDFVASKEALELFQLQNEGKLSDKENSGLVSLIFSLNNGTEGNPSLEESIGQRITSINVIQIKFDEETQKLIKRKNDANITGDALIAEAKKRVEIAKEEGQEKINRAAGEAEAIRLKGKAEADAIRFKVEALSGNTDALSRISIGDSLGRFAGKTLVIGGNNPVIIPADDGSGKKEETQKVEPKKDGAK